MMGTFAPTFLAFVQNSCGIYVFQDTKGPGCEPLVSCLIFLVAVFLLLWDIRLYPKSLRKQWKYGQFFVQYLLTAFMMEHIMNDFWFPLEGTLTTFLPAVSQFEKEVLNQGGWSGEGVLGFLKCEFATVIASYVLSIFFLMAVMHSTRIVDFRLLCHGPKVFFGDIKHRGNKFLRKLMKQLGLRKKLRVKFKQSHMKCKSRSRSRSRSRTEHKCGQRKPNREPQEISSAELMEDYLSTCTTDSD